MKNVIIFVTYNGENWISEQLDSIVKCRSALDKIVYWYDDGSTDNTKDMVQAVKDLKVHRIPNQIGKKSISENFLYTLNQAVQYEGSENLFYFCDQDDIWDSKKVLETEKYLHLDNILLLSNTEMFGTQKGLIRPNLSRNWLLHFLFNISPGMSFAFKCNQMDELLMAVSKFRWHDHGLFIWFLVTHKSIIHHDLTLQYYRRHEAAYTVNRTTWSTSRLIYGLMNFITAIYVKFAK